MINPERNLFLGVDPGQSGGLAILDPFGGVVDVSPMPETERDVSDYFAEFAARIQIACIESVHAMPMNGSKGNFKLGRSYGSLRMAMVTHRVPFEDVTPQAWQKAMRCMTGGDKNKTKARAQELFPGWRITHAIADALLISEHCRRQFSGKLFTQEAIA